MKYFAFFLCSALCINAFADVLPSLSANLYCQKRLSLPIVEEQVYFSSDCKKVFLVPAYRLSLEWAADHKKHECINGSKASKSITLSFKVLNRVNKNLISSFKQKLDDLGVDVVLADLYTSSYFFLEPSNESVKLYAPGRKINKKVHIDELYFIPSGGSIYLDLEVSQEKFCDIQGRSYLDLSFIKEQLQEIYFYRHYKVKFESGFKNFNVPL